MRKHDWLRFPLTRVGEGDAGPGAESGAERIMALPEPGHHAALVVTDTEVREEVGKT